MTSPNDSPSPENRARRHFLGLTVATTARAAAIAALVTAATTSPAHAGWKAWWRPQVRARHKGGGGGRGEPNCFLRGTAIRTATGEVPIETLRIGDLVETVDGRSVAIKWIGRQHYRRSAPSWHESVVPIRVARGALGHAMPHRDLYLSANHALLIDGVLIRVKELVNGTSIVAALPDQHETLDYYNIVLDTHEAILAEGAPVESYLQRESNYEAFDNFVEYTRLYPDRAQHTMTPVAPIVGYEGGWEHLKALLVLSVSGLVAVRDPIVEARKRLAARGRLIAA